MKIFICKPYWKHLFEKFPKDFKHIIHKVTAGIILIEHEEPDGILASEKHKDFVLFNINFSKRRDK